MKKILKAIVLAVALWVAYCFGFTNALKLYGNEGEEE